MMANSFLSAEELKLTKIQHRTLQQVLVMLECGELKHRDVVRHSEESEDPPNSFNMGWWNSKATECRSAGCIAGWADYLSKGATHLIGTYSHDGNKNKRLADLFHPDRAQVRTPEEAAIALRSYLTTGKA